MRPEPPSERGPEEQCRAAQRLAASGRDALALEAYGRVLRAFPEALSARVGFASMLARAGREDEAADILRRALADHPECTEARGLLSRLLRDRTMRLARGQDLGELLELKPPPGFTAEIEESLLARARNEWASGEEEAARSSLALLRRLNPAKPQAQIMGASLRFAQTRLTSRHRRELVTRGYTVLRGVADAGQVKAARKAIDAHFAAKPSKKNGSRLGQYGEYRSEFVSAPAVMDLLYGTKAWAAAESLVGRGQLAPDTRSQVVLRKRVPGREDQTVQELGLHVDGFVPPDQSRPSAAKLSRESFTVCLCMLLNDWPAPWAGNFTVSPGSHLLLAKKIKGHGLGSVLGKNFPRRFPPVTQITGKAGDLIIAHYLLAHDGAENRSPETRYACFFRLKHSAHRRRWRRALADPWLEWRGLKRP